MKNIFYRIAALWTVLVFSLSLLVEAFLLFITGWLKEPKKTEVFRRISIVWIRVFLFLVGCRLKVVGKENFEKGKVYVVTSNHNSFLDVPVLTPFVPGPNKTIAKIEMSRIPIFGLVYKRGSILVDRKDKESRKKSFLQMIQVIQKGMHMCIYPEGTRNKTSQPLKEFHDGAFRLAMDTQKDIIPTLIFNTKKILPADKGFWFKPGKIELHFLEPVRVQNYDSHEELKLSVHKIMSEYYSENQV